MAIELEKPGLRSKARHRFLEHFTEKLLNYTPKSTPKWLNLGRLFKGPTFGSFSESCSKPQLIDLVVDLPFFFTCLAEVHCGFL